MILLVLSLSGCAFYNKGFDAGYKDGSKRDMPRAMVKVKKSEKKLASTMVMILVTPTG